LPPGAAGPVGVSDDGGEGRSLGGPFTTPSPSSSFSFGGALGVGGDADGALAVPAPFPRPARPTGLFGPLALAASRVVAAAGRASERSRTGTPVLATEDSDGVYRIATRATATVPLRLIVSDPDAETNGTKEAVARAMSSGSGTTRAASESAGNGMQATITSTQICRRDSTTLSAARDGAWLSEGGKSLMWPQ